MTEYITFAQEHPLLFVGLAAILIFIIKTEVDRFTRKYNQLNTNEAVHLLNRDDTIVLDVREDKELSGGMINGAEHVPLTQLASHIKKIGNAKEKPLLVYCRSGSRSGAACKQLCKEGFTNVNNLGGGILGWEAANLPISK